MLNFLRSLRIGIIQIFNDKQFLLQIKNHMNYDLKINNFEIEKEKQLKDKEENNKKKIQGERIKKLEEEEKMKKKKKKEKKQKNKKEKN